MPNIIKYPVIGFIAIFFSLLLNHELLASVVVVGDTTGGSDIISDYGGPWLLTGNEDIYSFTPTLSGNVDFNLTPGATFDAALVVFTNLSNPSGTMLAFADSGIGGQVESLNIAGVAGTEYFLAVDGYANSVGAYALESIALTELTQVSAVPIPAAVWLFGPGFIGLMGVARRRKR